MTKDTISISHCPLSRIADVLLGPASQEWSGLPNLLNNVSMNPTPSVASELAEK